MHALLSFSLSRNLLCRLGKKGGVNFFKTFSGPASAITRPFVAQFTAGASGRIKKQLYYTEGVALKQVDLGTGNVTTVLDLVTEKQAIMPLMEIPLSQQRHVQLTGANIKSQSDGKLRATLYALVCKPLAAAGYYLLLLAKFTMQDKSCAALHSWSGKVSTLHTIPCMHHIIRD